MRQYLKTAFTLLLLLTCSSAIFAQGSIKGIMQDAGNKGTLAGVLIEIQKTDFSAQTNSSGVFEIADIPYGQYIVQFTAQGYQIKTLSIEVKDGVNDLGVVLMDLDVTNENIAPEDAIPTIMISDQQIESGSSGNESTAGLLNASNDIFSNKVSFAFSVARFRIRGYESDYTSVFMNNAPMNDLESGEPTWWAWSGLNDVTRNRQSSLGMAAVPYTFGDIGGTSFFDTRAGGQQKGFRFSYSYGNRSYNHRLMATYNTGLLPSGWAFSASASWRYAPEGAYVKGAYYNSASYYVGVEKQFGKQSIALSIMGTPSVRGKAGPAIQEMYTLAGTNYYNPNWGYQTSGKTGELQVRNAKVSETHQPLFILTHEADLTSKINLMTSVSYQFGKEGNTALDWYDAQDPSPDYYRKLPSYAQDPIQRELITQLYSNNERLRQIDWDRLYEINRNSFATIENVDGIQGNSVSGRRARYIVEERRSDIQKANANITLNANVAKFLTVDAGFTYQFYNSKNFKVVEDLLGADFYVDINRFVERDSALVGNENSYQNDLARPNRILKVGDRFGYDYDAFIHKASAWAQLNFTFSKLDFFLAGFGSYTTYWRQGNVQNGQFANNSLGQSAVQQFWNYHVKGGLTYKINGRNYLYANGSYQTTPPLFQMAYIAPRTRDQVLDSLRSSSCYSFEGGYVLNAPRFKLKLTGYYTKFLDQIFQRSFYLDAGGTTQLSTGNFVNFVMRGVEKQHAGVEVAGEVSLNGGISISAAASVGEYIYTARPTSTVYLDNAPGAFEEEQTIYIKNFYVPNTPQMAFNLGFWYRAPKFWTLSFNFNYFHANYADIYFNRRTIQAVSATGQTPQYVEEAIQQGSDLWNSILQQEEMPGQFSADVYISKSWKIKNFYFIISLSVSNMLNNTAMRTSGFEQFRFDYADKNVDKFPNKYYYAYGTNFMLNLTFRI